MAWNPPAGIEEVSLWTSAEMTPLETSEDEEGLLLIPAFKTQLHPSYSPCINLLLPCLEPVLGEGM